MAYVDKNRPLDEVDIPHLIDYARRAVARDAARFLDSDQPASSEELRQVPERLFQYICGENGQIDQLTSSARHFVGNASQIYQNFCCTCAEVNGEGYFASLITTCCIINAQLMFWYGGYGLIPGLHSPAEMHKTRLRQRALHDFIMGEGCPNLVITLGFSARMYAWQQLLESRGYAIPQPLANVLDHGLPTFHDDPLIGGETLVAQNAALARLAWVGDYDALQRIRQILAMTDTDDRSWMAVPSHHITARATPPAARVATVQPAARPAQVGAHPS